MSVNSESERFEDVLRRLFKRRTLYFVVRALHILDLSNQDSHCGFDLQMPNWRLKGKPRWLRLTEVDP